MAELELDLIGQSTFQDELASRDAETALAEDTTVTETLGAAWQQNLGPQIWKTLDTKFTHAPQDGFDPQMWLEENGATIPESLYDRFSGVRSAGEAAELAARVHDDIQNQRILQAKGATGVAASLIAGMADIDAPLTLLTGGYSKAATVAGRVAQGAAAGAALGVAMEGGRQLVDPLAETSDIITGGLYGAAFGGAGGLLLNRSLHATADEFVEARPGLHVNLDDYTFVDSDSSLGASYRGTDTVDTSRMSATQKDILSKAQATMRQPGHLATGETVADLFEDMGGADGHVAAAGRRFAEGIAKVPGLRSLFDDVAAGGTIMKAMAFDLLESPAGRVRNNQSASGLMSKYERVLATELMPIDNAYDQWYKREGGGVLSNITGERRKVFDRQVLTEMDNRAHGGPRTEDPLIRQAADALDAHYAKDLEIKLGRDGEEAVDGAQGLTQQTGHYTRSWDGAAIRETMRRGISQKRIEAMVASAYRKMHPTLVAEGHDQVVAKAIVRRALANEDGIDTNMLMTMNSDGQEFLRQTLKDSGYNDENFDALMKALQGSAEERGQLGSNKARIELDMRVSDGDLSMLDLINTNLTELTQRNLRKTAGAAALARKGITNKGQRKVMIDAAIAEMVARGDTDTKGKRTTMENMFTHFDGGPIAGGVDPTVSRMKRIANLGLLNQMGLTQAGETGAQIAAVGADTWKRHAKDVFNTLEKEGPNGRLAQELRPFMGELGNDHMLFRPELQLDEIRNDPVYAMELDKFLGTLDAVLGKGQRLQGYISGFYYVKSKQQQIAVTSMADKAFQHLRDGTGDAQLRDIGIDPKKFKKNLKHVEFSEEGFVNRLHMEKWDLADADDFATALNRYTHQVVQQGLAGEDSQWWHSSWGAIFSHLKTFPLAAMQKQAARNMNMGTPTATAMLTMGLATAGLVYAGRQVINGKDVPSAAEMAKGAFGMSNMTGWFPMFADPIAAMLGMNDMRFNQYGRHSASTGIVSVPPAIPTLNRMLHIPGALNPVGDMAWNDRIRALQAAPIIGNAVGFTAIFNAMKN